jgi:hypothetical protein
VKVLDSIDIRPTHPRVADTTDPLHQARNAEVTSAMGDWLFEMKMASRKTGHFISGVP